MLKVLNEDPKEFSKTVFGIKENVQSVAIGDWGKDESPSIKVKKIRKSSKKYDVIADVLIIHFDEKFNKTGESKIGEAEFEVVKDPRAYYKYVVRKLSYRKTHMNKK